ncbi:MAG: DMT family transporter [Longibaculum muris]|uniref:EamA-like transporter family protein n=1 Tax=Longibaculum muris TaxID=1796628 RepID=A0A4R3Z503_9FIRM|nr:DMT family transporter [Longibaculum muris]KXU44807.1 putative membrane protein [Candidatus Stoquefichus sp. KLE1796]MBS5369110.1 DMT family transporter [Coprobacillus cateniformis]MCR1887795.1 DMT family transporter [Longibaculum muris]MED9812201.1 DMT family transporter [Longibaculum muris]TCW01299.1 EamA-like transporter family protein [Longibaculum muris]
MKNKGIMFIVISALCFAVMNLFVKLSGDLPAIQKSFFRNFIAAFIALAILKKSGVGFHIEKKNVPLLLLRAILGTIGIIANFYAVDHLLLSDASIIQKLAPFFVIIFSFLLLKEKVSKQQILSIIIAFIGMLFVVKPSFANSELFASLIAMIGAMSAGMAYTLVRMLSQRGVKGPQIVFYFSLFSCLSVIPYLIFNFQPMTFQQIAYLLLAGIAAAGGQFAVTSAYSHSAGRDISIYDYSQVIFAALLGFIAFGQIPDYLSIIGYFVIFMVTFYMYLQNQRENS